jgi:predicted porin
LQLANSPGSLASNNGVPLNQQTTNGDSSRAGQFYNTVGYFGFESQTYGTLTFFRQNSLTLDGVLAYDPMSGSYAFSPIGFSGLVAGAGDTEIAKYSTSVKYRLNVGDFRVAGLWQFGGYQQNNGANGAWEADVGGDVNHLWGGVLSMDAIYTFAKDAVSLGFAGCPMCVNGVPGGTFLPQVLTATISNNTSTMLLAKYANGPFKLFGGYEWIQFAPPSDAQTAFTDLGGTPIGVGAPGTGINNTAYTAACGTGVCSDKVLQVVWTGAKYAITDKLDVIGAYYHYSQNTFTTASCVISQAHSQCSGTMDAFSGVIDWRLGPKWDAYFGMMLSQFNGGLANGYLARNNIDPTAGVRFRF